MDRRAVLLGGIGSGIAGLTGRAARAAPADLVIGAIGSLSGGATDWGVATQRGVQIAIDEVAAAGGLKAGAETYQPRMVIYDDTYSSQGGATAATRLVSADHARFIIGPIGSPAVLGALAVTTPAKVVMLTDGFSPNILTPGSLYNYRVSSTTAEFGPPMIRWIREKNPQVKRVAIIAPSDATGQQIVPIIERAYRDNGCEVVLSERYERGTVSDFTPLLTRVLAIGADLFEINSNPPAESGLMLKQVRQLGFRGLVVQTGGPAIEENIAVAGPLADGLITFDFLDPETPMGKSFVEAYRKKYTGTISTWAAVMYNAARLVFEAMRRSGSVEVEPVKAALEAMTGYETIFGPLRWGGKAAYGIDHQLMIDFSIIQVQGGKPVKVATVQS